LFNLTKETFRFHIATWSCNVELREAVTLSQIFPKYRDFLRIISVYRSCATGWEWGAKRPLFVMMSLKIRVCAARPKPTSLYCMTSPSLPNKVAYPVQDLVRRKYVHTNCIAIRPRNVKNLRGQLTAALPGPQSIHDHHALPHMMPCILSIICTHTYVARSCIPHFMHFTHYTFDGHAHAHWVENKVCFSFMWETFKHLVF
jgi:hypothetical protein